MGYLFEDFSFAGFYNDRTFTILTKDSENSKIQDIHDRTPVILSREEEEDYLDGELSMKALEEKVIEGNSLLKCFTNLLSETVSNRKMEVGFGLYLSR